MFKEIQKILVQQIKTQKSLILKAQKIPVIGRDGGLRQPDLATART